MGGSITVSPSARATLRDDALERVDALFRSGARPLTGFPRRLFLAEGTTERGDGRARHAERRFGGGRETVATGWHARRPAVRGRGNFAARRRPRREPKDPPLAADIPACVEPQTHADPELQAARRDPNRAAAAGRHAVIDPGAPDEAWPREPTLRDLLPRRNDRRTRLPNGKPRKKSNATEALVAQGKAVRNQVRDERATRAGAWAPTAQVAVGADARGGTNRDGRRR